MTINSALKLGLLLFAVIYVATIIFTWNTIEQDVAQRTKTALDEQGMNWAQVDTEERGRMVLLSGKAPTDAEREAAMSTAENVWGVQGVDSAIQFSLGDADKTYPAHLQIDKQGENIQLIGQLHDDVDKKYLIDFIGHRLDGDVHAAGLQRASNVEQAAWLDDLRGFLYEIDSDRDIRITLRDQRLIFDGAMSSDDASDLMHDARDHFSDYFSDGWSIENRVTLADASDLRMQDGDSLQPELCQVYMNTLVNNQSINFAMGSVEVHNASNGLIKQVAEVIKACDDNRVRVEGHTDNMGDAQQNQLLSEQRANAVLGLLVKFGVDKARVEARGYGMYRPVEANTSDEGRAKNRRIEFRVLSNAD